MKKLHFYKFLLLLANIMISSLVIEMKAQLSQLQFEQITIENGLSNNRVHCILRDSRDFLWIGTPNGLNKFDGQKITVYKNIKSKSSSVSGNSISCIYEDRETNLWIGTSAGLNLFDRKSGNFKYYLSEPESNDQKNEKQVRDNNIFSILEDDDGNIWCTTENGLKKLDKQKTRFKKFDLPVKVKNLQSSQPIRAGKDAAGIFWLATQDNKLWSFDPRSLKFTSYTDQTLVSTLTISKVIAVDKSGTIWLGTEGYGLYSFEPSTEKFQHYRTDGNGIGTHGKSIKSLFIDRDRYLYIAVDLGGINRFDLNNKTFEYCRMNEKMEHGLNSDAIWSVYKDKEDILYVGTSVSGININNPKRMRFQTYRSNANNENSLIYNVVFKFFEDSQGLIWIGTDGGGLSVFDPVKKTFKNYRHNPADPYSISGNAINSFTEDKNHDIWIGAWGAGLNRFDRKTGRFYHYMPDELDPHAILNPHVWDLSADTAGNIWIIYNYGGCDLFNIQKGVIKHYRQDASYPEMLSPSMTNRIVRQHNGETGLASHNGYYVLNRTNSQFEKLEIFKDYDLLDVYLDHNGNYWGGTSNNGLIIVRAGNKVEKYDETNGFPSNTVSGFLEDSKGNIWILTSDGLSESMIDTGKFRHFNIADGLQGNQFMNFAFLKSHDGTIYVGGYNGFNVFRPKDLVMNSYIPPVYIDEFQIFNEPVTVDSPDSPLKETISETRVIHLSYTQSVFSFGFTALNFTYPEKNLYAYKMEGWDNKWNYTNSNRRYVTYTNLDPGEYTFMVKAANNDGIWNETPATIKIIISPPFWETIWFRVLVIFLVIGSAIGFYKARIQQYKNNKRRLERKVKERTNELEAANVILKENQEEMKNQNDSIIKQRDILDLKNRELESKNQEIVHITDRLHESDQMKIRFFTNISHDLRTPLTLILGSLESIITGISENIVLTRKLNILQSNAGRMLRLVNQLLDFRKIDTDSLKIRAEFHDVILFIHNVFDSFVLNAERQKINYTLKTSHKSLNTWFDPDILDKILYNVLSNAFKFTPDGGKISLSVDIRTEKNRNASDYDALVISVTDTGIGVHKKDIEKIFDRFYQAGNAYSRKYQGSGIGLALVKHLVEIHQGSISVKSNAGKGSEFQIVIAVGNALSDSKPLQGEVQFYEMSNIAGDENQVKEKPLFNTLFNGSTVLIVEDNEDLRNFIRDEISSFFRVIESSNGKEGIDIARREVPDLIISDVMMPVMDGFEMCEHLKYDWQTSHIPVIILTAKADESSFLHGLEVGADAYIRKPFSMKHLLKQIENLLLNRLKMMDKLKSNHTLVIERQFNSSEDKKFIETIYSCIEENISDSNFGVEMLSEKLSMSRSLLYKKVLSAMNAPVGELIRNIRLQKASLLLRDKKNAVSDVALMVGFSDRPQFSRSFTNMYGLSPKQFQNQEIDSSKETG